MKRVSAREYAKQVGRCRETIEAMCRNGGLKARKVGRSWQIDVEASEKLLSLRFGNSVERELAKKS